LSDKPRGGIVYQPHAQRLANALQRERHFANGLRPQSLTGEKGTDLHSFIYPYLSVKIT
jgi:hypothetical protein